MSDNNNFKPNLEGYKPLRPFNLFMKNNFPFIENTFEALDTYGLICQLVKYLNTVIENEQTTEHNVSLLSNAFNELNDYVSHYFDNLDVQEEINNKLDDMVEAGTLQEIIADYLNSKAVFGFDTVSDMKNSTNLINGSYAKTLGYRAKNDNGAGLYKIRTITNDDVIDEKFIIALNDSENELIAELIIENIVPETIGAYGNGTNDDTSYFQALIDKGVTFKLNKNKTYKISSLSINSNFYLDGNDSTILVTDSGFVFTDNDKYKHIENLNVIIDSEADQFIYCNSTIGDTSYNSKGIFEKINISTNDLEIPTNQISAIKIKGGRNYLISNCNLIGTGIILQNTVNPTVTDSTISTAYLGILQESIDADYNGHACGLKVDNCTILGCTIGIKSIQSDSLQICNSMIDYDDYPIVNIATSGLKINNCYVTSRNGNQTVYVDKNNNYENEIFRGNGRDTEVSNDVLINSSTFSQNSATLTTSSIEIHNGFSHNITDSVLPFIGKSGIEVHDVTFSNFKNLSIRSSLADSSAFLSYRSNALGDDSTNMLENFSTNKPIYVHYAKTNLNDSRSYVTKQEGTTITTENSVEITTTIVQGINYVIISLANSTTSYSYTINPTNTNKFTVSLGEHTGATRINWLAVGKTTHDSF